MRNKPSTQIQRTQNNESPMSLTVLGPRGCKNEKVWSNSKLVWSKQDQREMFIPSITRI